MIEELKNYLLNDLGFDTNQKLVLAVSGGRDSMCLWFMMRELKLSYVIAHCNFNLRGDESDADEDLVENFCLEGETLYTKSVDTLAYAQERKISIQMAARELRYTWFDEIAEREKAQKVATAHHLDDQVETFFIQLLRKGDVNSLTGIPVLTKNRIRPLMFTNRTNITNYVLANNIPFRDDTSNASDKYLRNKLRNHLIPAIEKVDANLKNKVLELMSELKHVNAFVQHQLTIWEQKLAIEKNGDVYYDISGIKKLDFPELFIEKIMRQYGFNKSVTEMLKKALDGQSGKVFYGLSKKLIKDRNQLIFTDINESDEVYYSLFKDELPTFSDLPIIITIEEMSAFSQLEMTEEIAQLDYDKLNSHIIFRKWKEGDNFIPLGMKGRRKLSDYFIDKKFNLSEKNKQWLMLSGNEICCVIGQRIDDRYKITNETTTVLTIRVNK